VAALRAGNPDVFHAEEEPFGGARRDGDANAVLLAGATDADPVVRRIAVEILAELRIPEAVGPLRRSLADADAGVRGGALRGLAGAADAATLREIASSLHPLLADPDPEVRARAAGALARSGDPAGREALVTMVGSAATEERRASIAQLGEIAEEPERVLAGLADPDPAVRRTAVWAVARSGSDRTPALIEALGDPDAGVRDEAAAALAGFGTAATSRLVAALSRRDLEAGALLALSRGPGGESEALRSYALREVDRAGRYHDLWRQVRPDGDGRLELVAEALRDRALRHGLNALRAVAPFGDRSAIEVALENLGSRDPGQRANALETLEAVGEPEVARPLLAVWESPPGTAGNGRNVLSRLLRDDDPWLRACAAFAARMVDDDDMASTLAEMARSDPDPLVQEAAAGKGDGSVETLSTLSTMERVLFLRKVRLFGDLSPQDLKQVAEVASEHLYPDGEVIAEQGEAGDEMHIVVSGEIRVLLTRDGQGAEEVARRVPGEYVGEMAILSQEPRMASLVCAGEVRTLSIDRRRFERILRERPDTSLAVMRVLSDRLRQSHAREPVAKHV
jgi:HEAT repeat protein